MRERIVFIGGGNMAASLIGGLQSAGHAAARIRVVDPDPARRALLEERYAVATAGQGDADFLDADVWVLAVKPQAMQAAIEDLAPSLPTPRPLVLSVAAGVPVAALTAGLGEDVPLVRCMPNTPALIGAGVSALYAAPTVTSGQRETAQAVLESAGAAVWVENEAQLDAVTATSGSGPAYFFKFMEAMQSGAEELGLPAHTARELALRTALGAARMALEAGEEPATLRERVTSPGGTTERALAVFAEGGLDDLVARAMRAAADRSRELAAGFTPGAAE